MEQTCRKISVKNLYGIFFGQKYIRLGIFYKALGRSRIFVSKKTAMKNIILFTFLYVFIVSPLKAAEDWGQNGHRTTAQIAEKHLKKRVLRKITQLLDGQSLAVASTFADDIKSDKSFDKYSKWHYVNIPAGKTYEAVKEELGENIIWAINKCTQKLQNKNTPKKEKQFYLKMLVHLVGDLHQPMHIGRAEDRGGNDIKVDWFGKHSNLHRVWDSQMIENYKMSFTELSEHAQILSKKEIKHYQEGNPETWAVESKNIADALYANAENNRNFGYKYMYLWFPVLKERLQIGGVRLAKILNNIFA